MAFKEAPKICIECQSAPVLNKKRGLCRKCYTKLRKSNGITKRNSTEFCSTSVNKYENEGEIEFIKSFFNHTNWIHHPCTFKLRTDERYSPDFYDCARNVFIEVINTRQAYHQNLHKYDLFVEDYPLLNFEIRNADGSFHNHHATLSHK